MKTDKPESERAAAARLTIAWGTVVTRSMVRYWKSKNYDLEDAEGLKRRVRNQERCPAIPRQRSQAAPKETPEEMAIYRICQDLERKLWDRLIDVIPAEFVGMTADEMTGILTHFKESQMDTWDEILGE